MSNKLVKEPLLFTRKIMAQQGPTGRDGGLQGEHSSVIVLNKNCRICLISLNTINAAKKNKKYFRNECKKCRSKNVVYSMVGNEKRKSYMREYVRKKGIVKEWKCEYIPCNEMCIKKYARAFCSDICRFMFYVKKSDSCWIWKGPLLKSGYGKFCFKNNKTAISSRVSYEIFKGPIDNGLHVCHSCDNKKCVNPSHLWLGTHIENMIDMIDKGRQYSILMPSEVFKIRSLHKDGYSMQKIKELFNISSSRLSNILSYRTWKHV